MRPIDRVRRTKDLTLGGQGDDGNMGSMFARGFPWGRTIVGNKERIESSFESYVRQAYKANGIIFACVQARALPFSEARFLFQERVDGRPGHMFDDPSLQVLRRPWTNGTTGELLWRMEQNASLAGNFYATPVSDRLRVLRPDWVTIVSGIVGDPEASAWELQSEVLGYIYEPKGVGRKVEPVFITPARMVHYSPIPDPEAQWRGMSWLTPVLREIDADSSATKHKLGFFERGAMLGTVVRYDKTVDPEKLPLYKKLFDESHAGTDNSYSTLHLGGGADVTVIGADLKQLDFKATQGAGETRIAAAAGVGAIIARFSEGMQGSSLNTGNYGAAKRQFGDMTLRPLWRSAAASLEKLTNPPANAELVTDTRDVEFLKEDRKDAAAIMQTQATTVRLLVDAGYVPESVVKAVEVGDFNLLQHSGLYSVQLQSPGGDQDLPLNVRAEAAGALVRAGYDPAEALSEMGLDPIAHLGLLPITLQSPKQLELTAGEAAAVTN